MGEILERASEALCARLGSSGCAILLHEEEGLRLAHVRGETPRDGLEDLVPPADLNGHLVTATGETSPPGTPSRARATGWIGLSGAEGPTGAIFLWWDQEPEGLEEAEVAPLVEDLGIQIENARLFIQVERAKKQWEATADALREGIALVDAESGRILRANWALARELSSTPAKLVGLPLRETVFVPLGLGQEEVPQREEGPAEREIQARGRTWRLVGYPLEEASARVVILEDVTERRRAHQELVQANAKITESMERLRATQAQLVQSEKMAAVGQLISGVAHELNNPLTAVLGFAQLLDRAPDEEKRATYSETIRKEAERARKIVQNLLTFARKRRAEKSSLDLAEVVEQTLELKAYEMRVSGVELTTELQEDLPSTTGDFQQLQQVVLNLLNNAVHAVLSTGRKGRIRVATRLRGKDDPGEPDVSPPSVVLEIRDNGPGIPEAHRSRIFEPFFTTKDVGQGTGLGLSLAYGIVKEHGGAIRATDNEDGGATFLLELPVRDTAEETAAAHQGAASLPDPATLAARRILVVDDEESIRTMLQELLEDEGHSVATASDGRLALQQIGEDGAFDLILTDLKMPVMDGYGFYQCLRKEQPDLADRVVFITGDTVSQQTRNFLLRAGNRYLPKPLSLQSLREVVRDLPADDAGPRT